MLEIKIKEFLKEKINNYYKNSYQDYKIKGEFLNIKLDGNELTIIHEEQNVKYMTVIDYIDGYSLTDIYNIWQESDWQPYEEN